MDTRTATVKRNAMTTNNNNDNHHTLEEIYSQIDRDGKRVETVSTLTFWTTSLVGLPLLCLAIAPLSILYQAMRIMIVKSSSTLSLDNNTELQQVEPKEIVPRQERKYDVVVLGSTGFAGRLVVRYLAKTYGVGKEVCWAIAGRSMSKLETVKLELAKELGTDEIMGIDTIVVDTSVPNTIPALVKDTRVVVTTAGPFGLYGSSVVEGCAKYGTHYADITGEVDWVKRMMPTWDATARRTGAKLVPFCGHDSIPWDLTVMKLEQELLLKGQELVRVECLNESSLQASGGTVATVLQAVVTPGRDAPRPKHEFNVLRKLPDGSESSARMKTDLPFAISRAKSVHDRLDGQFSSYSPFSSVNAQVVKWSLARRQMSKQVTYKETTVSPDFKTSFVGMFQLAAGLVSILNPLTRHLLEKFVLPKPGEGPSMEDMEKKHFLVVTGHGVGCQGAEVQSVMYFPRDSGYLDTARMLAESGLALALDEDKLPSKGGGFFSPSTAMGDVLLDRICATGTYFASSAVNTD